MRRRIVLLCLAAMAVLPLPPAAAMTRSSAAAATVDWSGQWSTTYGPMRLTQRGNEVTGVYNYDREKSEIRATASGRRLTGVWDERPDDCDTGPIDWTMSEDGASFEGTWGPGCGSGGRWKGTRTVAPILSVSVKAEEAERTQPNADSALVVSVKNTGTAPAEFVSVDSLPAVKGIKSSCRRKAVKVGELTNGSQGTIAPGETHVPSAFFDVTHVCAGSADVTVTVRGSAPDGSKVTGRATARVKVPDGARIRGTVKPVPAWTGEDFGLQRLRTDEVEKLRQGITVRAKGPKRTLSTRVSPSGTYEIEVPRKALGRYEVTAAAPKATELRPGRRTVVDVRAGETAVRDYEAGYSCETKLPGRGFVVRGGFFQAGEYRCRSRRLLLVVALRPGRRDQNGSWQTTCTRGDGSTYEVGSFDDSIPLLLAMEPDGVLRGGFTGYGRLSATATFLTPGSLDVHVDSTDCLEDQHYVQQRAGHTRP